MGAADYLRLPYMHVVVPEDDGTFRAEVLEFPGCLATGDSRQEALAALLDAAESWIESMLASGQAIPPPMESNDFSGKLVLRMPRSLHRKAAFAAERDGVSLNQFIVNSLAEHVGSRSAPPQMRVQNYAHVQVLTYGLTQPMVMNSPQWAVGHVPVQALDIQFPTTRWSAGG